MAQKSSIERSTRVTLFGRNDLTDAARSSHEDVGDINPTDIAADHPGSGTRMLIYSHDTFGLGHLQRCLKISGVLASRFPGISILLVTGSPVVHRYELPVGVDYIKLPAVRKVGPEQYEARTLSTSYQRIVKLRTTILLETVREFDPHILLVDHSPIGMKGEMRASLEWLRESGSDCVTLLGLRDLLDAPETVIKHWSEQGVFEVLDKMYSHLLVYGMQSFFDPIKAYQFPAEIAKRTFFCNYIGEATEFDGESSPLPNGNRLHRQSVLVTIGGGDGGVETVILPYLEMLRYMGKKIDFDTEIVTGPFVSTSAFQQLEEASRSLPVCLHRFVPSVTPLMWRSDLVVATGGYNTVTQLLGAAKRALIIPRIMHRQEQLMRAERLAELGVVDLLEPDAVTVDALYGAISKLLRSTLEPVSEAREKNLIHLDGAGRLAEFCSRFMVARRKIQEADGD